ncbi:probable LRR receptor-like serine/threonine-protein kinase At3g47570 [Actinidia eriantha]|uniref:probable LRR receptor-like serine/threonine-protein kinase At3g47570 n=1 Tax=Actinidia eriantha TaxID=165200 RepID=UPI002587D955|nr:probable LRR receptor-like serine/threonine-protein kinase At3g47570 [Actinidia eriantha]
MYTGYGILLLELFTGKRPTNGMFIDGLDLHKLAKLALTERVMEIVDQNLLEKEEGASKNSSKPMKSEKISKCLSLIFRIGVACSEQLPRERMTIVDAVRELHLAKDILLERRTWSNVSKFTTLPQDKFKHEVLPQLKCSTFAHSISRIAGESTIGLRGGFRDRISGCGLGCGCCLDLV